MGEVSCRETFVGLSANQQTWAAQQREVKLQRKTLLAKCPGGKVKVDQKVDHSISFLDHL